MCCIFAVGCESMPISAGIESENSYLFESPQALKKIVKENIYSRMSEEEVDRVLGISFNVTNRVYLSDDVVYASVFAGAQVRSTTYEEVLVFAGELLRLNYSGWDLPFRLIKKKGYLEDVANIVTESLGYDLYVRAIFQDGQLYKIGVYGSPNVNRKKSFSIIWKALTSVPGKVIKLL